MSAFWNAYKSPDAPSPAAEQVEFWVNGAHVALDGHATALPLSTWLRERRSLTGTKVACGSGDCGSCTVLVASPHDSPPRWQAVNACLRYVHQLHGCELRTVEGLGTDDTLTPVQQALVDGHGTQCGMCTPGFVMQMTCALQTPPQGEANSTGWWAHALRGNVCRCTGYTSIFEAGIRAATGEDEACPSVPPFTPAWLEDRERLTATAIDLVHTTTAEAGTRRSRTLRPATLRQALHAAAAFPDCVIAAGTTDLAVDAPDRETAGAVWLDISALRELAAVSVVHAGQHTVLSIGALATWQHLDDVVREACPPVSALLQRMGGPQIHASATVGGNVMTASSIGDLLPLLVAMHGTLEFAHRDGTRRVLLADALTAYRTIDRRAGEILTRIDLPLPGAHERLVLEKVSRRRDVDIATVSLAARWHEDDRGALRGVVLVAGGVAPHVVRLAAAEARLNGSPGNTDDWQHAARLAVSDIAPRDDVRASAAYRRRVLEQLIVALAAYDASGAAQP